MGLAGASHAHQTDPLPPFLEKALAKPLPGEKESGTFRFANTQEHLAWQP
jgi:hypothetical protein